MARYLQRNEVEPTDEKYILEQLQLWEARNPIHPSASQGQPFDFSLILGILFIAGGIFIAILLWDNGLVGTLPLILVGAGIYGIIRKGKIKIHR